MSLIKLLSGMNIPDFRKDKITKQNLEWLNKNLGARNKQHSDFEEADILIKSMLKNNCYKC